MSKADEPIHPIHGTMGLPKSFGLTKREYFAAAALPSVVLLVGIPEKEPDDLWDAEIAKRCVAIADALITALERKPE